MENYRNEQVGQSPLVLAKAPALNHGDYCGRKFLFNKNKAIKRYVKSHIMSHVPHSSALKKISSFDYHNYLSAVAIPTAPIQRLVFTVRTGVRRSH